MHPKQIEIYRNMSMARKMELIQSMHDNARKLKAVALRQFHPNWTEEQVQAEVRRIFLLNS